MKQSWLKRFWAWFTTPPKPCSYDALMRGEKPEKPEKQTEKEKK